MKFTPSSIGDRTGRLSITIPGFATYYIPVTGTGVSSISSSATLSPSSLTFQDLSPLSVASTQSVTLTNSSTGPMNIQSVLTSSGFTQTNNCGSALPAQSVCTISVASNQPTIAATIQGVLTVTDDFGSQSIPLTGIIDQILQFGTWSLGQTSATPSPFQTYAVPTANEIVGDNDFQGTGCGTHCHGLFGFADLRARARQHDLRRTNHYPL